MINEELIRYPEPDERLRRGNLTDLLAFLGPGLILASASIGSGEVFFSARGGAIFQYALLWTFLLGVVHDLLLAQQRGLHGVDLVVSDHHNGLIRAIHKYFQGARPGNAAKLILYVTFSIKPQKHYKKKYILR